MNYENIYESFYSKYYSKAEILIKNFFIKRHSQKRTFGNSINEVNYYFNNDFISKYNLYNNESLEMLHQIFCKRHSIYYIDEVQEVFADSIKKEFDKIKISELPVNYNYTKFIKEIAIIEVEKEISRLLSNNAQLLGMFYKLCEFDEFEIKEYRNLSLEDYPIYKKLHSKLYPEYYTDLIENKDLVVLKHEAIDLDKLTYNPNHWNAKTFDLFNYLVENYEKKGKVKYINIYKFIKNLESNTYVMTFIHNTYKSYVLEKYGIKLTKMEVAEYDYELKDQPILKSWEELFRKSSK